LVSLAAGSRDWHQVVVADEDAQVGLTGEALLDPAVVFASDLAFVEVGSGGGDRDESDFEPVELEAEARVAGAEGVLEVQVPDIAGVVVARHANDQRARQRGELLLGERVLVGVALVGEVASDDDEVGRGRVDLLDCGAENLLAIAVAADVDVGELRDQHRHSLTRPQWPRPTGPPQPAHAPPPDRTDCQARAGSGTGVPKRDLRLLPNGAARSPFSEGRVRTPGFRPGGAG